MPKGERLPNVAIERMEPDKKRIIVQNLLQLNSLGKPLSDDDLEKRINEYFKICVNSGVRPGIESLALALSVTRITIWKWSNGEGCSSRRQEMICMARQVISAYLEQSMMAGQLNPVSAIFLLKNWANYSDSVQIEQVSSKPGREPTKTAEELLSLETEIEDANCDSSLDFDD